MHTNVSAADRAGMGARQGDGVVTGSSTKWRRERTARGQTNLGDRHGPDCCDTNCLLISREPAGGGDKLLSAGCSCVTEFRSGAVWWRSARPQDRQEGMVELGTLETIFMRPTLLETFGAVRSAGFSCVQFDVSSAGVESQAEAITGGVARSVRDQAGSAGIWIASISGTFNMIHPDRSVRERGLAWLNAIASTCAILESDIVTLCTGTRDRESMWRGHQGNGSADAWADLVETIGLALAIADRHHVRLVIEPEPANVVRDADRAFKLLEEMANPRLKVVLDPANILAGDPGRSPEAALDHAFDLLGSQIILAHAKDLDERGTFCAAGTGIVPWAHYRRLLRNISYDGDVIFHTLTEDQAPFARAVLAD